MEIFTEKMRSHFKKLRINYRLPFTYCNLRCEYCYVKEKDRNKPLEVNRYFSIIEKISKLEYLINIRLAVHGEPFLSKPLMDGVFMLTYFENIEAVNIQTNLTIDKKILQSFLEKINPNKFCLVVSFHHSQIKDIDSFLDNIRLLREKNILFVVECVAHPPYLNKIEKYKSFFEKELNIPFFVDAFLGTWLGKKYPECYTRLEKKIIRKLAFSDLEYYYMMKIKPSYGKLCSAGKYHIGIKEDGSIWRCLVGSTYIGNILEGRLNLFEDYRPCDIKYKYCRYSCRMYRLLEFRNKFIETKNERLYYPR